MELKQPDYSSEIQSLKKEIALLRERQKGLVQANDLNTHKKWTSDYFKSLEERIAVKPVCDYEEKMSKIEVAHENLQKAYVDLSSRTHEKDHVPTELMDRIEKLDRRITSFTDVNLEPTDIGCRNFFQEFLKARDQGFKRAENLELEVENLKKILSDAGAPTVYEKNIPDVTVDLVNTLANNVSILKNQLADVSLKQEQVLEKSAPSANFESLEPRFKELNDQIVAVQKNALVLMQSIAQSKTDINALMEKIDDIKVAPTKGSVNLQEIYQPIGVVEQKFKAFVIDFNKLKEDIDIIKRKLSSNRSM